MATWKKREESGELRFQHLCGPCHRHFKASLQHEGWELLREGEPVSCSACALNCRLTAQGLWGEADAVRYAVCAACPDLSQCPLKGRYYC